MPITFLYHADGSNYSRSQFYEFQIFYEYDKYQKFEIH